MILGEKSLRAKKYSRRETTRWTIVAHRKMGRIVGQNSLSCAVPLITRAGMASATADLRRDFGVAIMQSILGALLTTGYALLRAVGGGAPDVRSNASD
jgi:hypothetical protein